MRGVIYGCWHLVFAVDEVPRETSRKVVLWIASSKWSDQKRYILHIFSFYCLTYVAGQVRAEYYLVYLVQQGLRMLVPSKNSL